MAKVRKRVLPSGEVRFLADYFDGSGKRRSKQFDKRKDADAYLVKVRRDLQLGVHVADSASLTVREASRLWLDRCADDGLERSTRDAYDQHVRLHILPLIGAKKLTQITTPSVHTFADDLRSGGCSPDMVKRVVRSLGAIFGEARRRGYAATNPVSDAQIKVGDRRKNKRPDIPSKADLRAILNAAQGKHRALIVTALFSGLRASELRGLRWDAVDLKAGVLTVKTRVDAWGEFGPPKTSAGERDVPLAPIAVTTLKQQRLAIGANGPAGLVFPSDEGTPLNHQNIINRIWDPLQIGAGLYTLHETKRDEDGEPAKVTRYNFHALRHAAASLFIEQKLSPKRVQTLMGHSSITVTFDTYGHLFEDAEADQTAVAEIEARLLRE
ncbi:site-specific integrase [Mesorhizobium sp. B2-1-8]|uniref:tyrosine-type recombinase/integrase n=1 Tax=Mesorhizobium sp. B2-1-8 TaxID=2589967 RepID=UPI0011275E99|nr:site-specific integrase [Mesorhizobium sp. B2-1-8]UCI17878.1 site-specific integrase [Mesorhizobium sp. B2-1-8]